MTVYKIEWFSVPSRILHEFYTPDSAAAVVTMQTMSMQAKRQSEIELTEQEWKAIQQAQAQARRANERFIYHKK